jgi:hypothetical protein
MKALLDSIVIGVYLLAIAMGGKYSLSYMAQKVQGLALEKAAQGLGVLEPVTQRLTGKKLNF